MSYPLNTKLKYMNKNKKKLIEGVDYKIVQINNGSIIHHLSERSRKQSHEFINNLIKHLDLVKEGFHLLPT